MGRYHSDRELPRFDRNFLGSPAKFTRIGKGALGGKAEGARREEAMAEMRAWLAKMPGDDYRQFAAKLDQHDFRILTAVDGMTGKALYEHGVDLSNAGGGVVLGYSGGGGGDKQQNPYIMSSLQAHGGTVICGTAGSACRS